MRWLAPPPAAPSLRVWLAPWLPWADPVPPGLRCPLRPWVRSLPVRTLPGDLGGTAVVLTPPPELPLPGTVLDKYRLEALLGVGGFAAVYRATHLLLHKACAIKMILPARLAHAPQLAAQLRREAALVAQIDHPNLVRVYDVTETPSLTYLVMELLPGETLAARLQRQAWLTPAVALAVAAAVAAALAAGQAHGIIHRDVKPGNIMLGPAGEVHLIDLGLARVHGQRDIYAGRGPVGTWDYMAPEQQRGEAVDFRADLYGLGASLYHALAGAPPDPQRSRLAAIWPPMAAILAALLAPERSQRPASYAQLLAALGALSPSAPG